jgi:hypothetical protein
VKVRDARALASRWVVEHAADSPNFGGAYVAGSAAWLAADDDLPATSDVDVTVVTTDTATPKLGKTRYGGVVVDVSYLPATELASTHRVLAAYQLAGNFRTDTILADPTGRLADLHVTVATEFARRRWVRLRCDDAERKIVRGLEALDAAAAWPEQVTTWLFATGVTTHVLLTAGLRNPTVRLRYLAVRRLLEEYGRLEFHDELLALLGCRGLSRVAVERHLDAMTAAFDAAAREAKTRFSFSSDITPAARSIAVDGSRELVGGGSDREAVFWIAVTYARCQTILEADAPPEVRDAFGPGFRELLADLGIESPDDLRRRAFDVAEFLPRLREMKEDILLANRDIED